MWFVYIIQCEDKSLYTGCTNDLERRFQEYSLGIGSKYTYSHKPIKILFSERCIDRSGALKREHQIKGWSHDKNKIYKKSKFAKVAQLVRARHS